MKVLHAVSRMLLIAPFLLTTGAGRCEAQEATDDMREAMTTVYDLQSQNEQQIRRKLEEKVDLQYREAPIPEVIKELSERSNVVIMFDESALDAGMDSDTIDMYVVNVSLRSALHIICEPYDCTFVIKNEVLKIVAEDVAEDLSQLRLYDVSDLDITNDELVDAITSSVDPDSWETAGGLGTIYPMVVNSRKILVIGQTEKRHETVLRLIKGIREAVVGKPAVAIRTNDRIKSYHIAQEFNTTAHEVVTMIQDSLGDDLWNTDESHFIKSYGSIVVVRQSSDVVGRIDRFLSEAGIAKARGFGSAKSGGFGGAAGGGGVFAVPDAVKK